MRLSKITISTVAGGEQTLTLQDYQNRSRLAFYGEAPTSVGGKKHARLKGLRLVLRIDYRHSIEPDTFRSVVNNVVNDLTSGKESIVVSEGEDLSNAVNVIPTERFNYMIQSENTINRFIPFMEFESLNVDDRLASRYVEVGYVTVGYVE